MFDRFQNTFISRILVKILGDYVENLDAELTLQTLWNGNHLSYFDHK